MTEEPTLREALGDVRRAFRLLWFYQDRILDIVRTIASEFEDLRFYYCVPHNTVPRDRSNSELVRNAWYALPFMNVSYLTDLSVILT